VFGLLRLGFALVLIRFGSALLRFGLVLLLLAAADDWLAAGWLLLNDC